MAEASQNTTGWHGERKNKHADEPKYAQLLHKGSGPDKDKSTPIYFHKLLDFSYLIQTQRTVFDPVTRLMTLEATVCSWDFSHLTSTPYFHVTWQMTEISLTLHTHESLCDLPYKNIKFQWRQHYQWYVNQNEIILRGFLLILCPISDGLL